MQIQSLEGNILRDNNNSVAHDINSYKMIGWLFEISVQF